MSVNVFADGRFELPEILDKIVLLATGVRITGLDSVTIESTIPLKSSNLFVEEL